MQDAQQLFIDLATTLQGALNEIVDVVNNNAVGASTYTVTNVSASRTLDASAATLDQLRQVVGTLLRDQGSA